ncbi:hypothetical protein E8E14_009025 [Neopestalotiopsis sp. 37M]|nr:hypothetical protein E8E14_009025 [Neopestalotiopsis sp. 37M]
METQRSSTDTHFLSDNEKDELALLDAVVADYENSKGRRKSKSWIRRHWKAVGWHLLFNLFTLVLLVFGLGDLWSATGLCKSPVYDPGRSYLTYEVRELEFADEDTNEFKPYTDEADKAWHDLMDWTYVRLTDKDLAAMNKTSVPLGDGGYLGMPVLFHEVHCVVNAPGILNHPIYGPSYPGARRVDEKWSTPQVLPAVPYEGPMAI